ncbi:MAG: signal peptidase I [Bacilli bacterium]|nr:signal peptidase I [Bacilli bacterium]
MLVKIKDFIFRIIYILLIIYLLIFIPSLWGYKPLVVISGSMEPTLKVGGILYYEKIDIDEFNEGDILVYQTKDHIISHRIVDIIEDDFITKGDKNNSVDNNLVNINQILGKGTNWSIPLIGYYADYIYGHKYILYISLGIIIVDLCNDVYKEHKKKVGKKHEKE